LVIGKFHNTSAIFQLYRDYQKYWGWKICTIIIYHSSYPLQLSPSK
jgi:hypothetical protein